MERDNISEDYFDKRDAASIDYDLKQSNIPSGTISIEGLSQMIMGTCSADTLVQQEILCCDTEQTPVPILQSIWPKQTNFINEYY